MKQPIYLNNIELALRMYEAGFDSDCVFRMVVSPLHSGQYRCEVLMNGLVVNSCDTDYMGIFDKGRCRNLPLPTLGEIELPEELCIIKNPCGTYHIRTDEGFEDIPNTPAVFFAYPTELEARCHAWLWANKKEVQNE